MKFSVGIWDSLFGEKVEIEIPCEGRILKQSVTKKWLSQMKHQGKVSSLITAYVLDPMYFASNPNNPVFSEGWEIGKNISQDAYEKFKDLNGNIYVLNVYEDGKLKQLILKKDVWSDAKDKMDEM